MKEIHLSTYLKKNLEENRKRFTRNNLLIVISIMITFFTFPAIGYSGFAAFLFLASVPVLVVSAVKNIRLRKDINTFNHGLQGEKTLQQVLQKLPDDYVAMYNVPVNGSGDIDCLLVGPRGVFAIEVKSHKGIITYSENGWTQIKIGRRGTPYRGNLKDPRKQLLTTMHKFKDFLQKNGVNVWIQPVIVFTNPETNLILEKDPKPAIVCKVEHLLDVISSSNKHLSSRVIDKICWLVKFSGKNPG